MTLMNRTFKDLVAEDLDVFFNCLELAKVHELDGEFLDLVVESNVEHVKDYSRDQLSASQEVFVHLKTIFVKSCDFYVPKVGNSLMLDGEEYYVEEASEDMGIIRIVVSANES